MFNLIKFKIKIEIKSLKDLLSEFEKLKAMILTDSVDQIQD